MTPLRARASLRLAALVAGAVILPSLAGMALLQRLAAREIAGTHRVLVAADVEGLAALYDQRRILGLRAGMEARAAADAASGAALLLIGQDGAVMAGNLPAWPAGLAAAPGLLSPAALREFALPDGSRWLGVALSLPGGFPLLFARPLAPVEAAAAELRRVILLVAAAMVFAGGAVGWLAARRVLSRIERINALADRVAAGALDARLPGPRASDEFGLLETHVHGMLDRIQNLNRATQHLSDTIAHELRTPLSRMMQRLSALEGTPEAVEALRAEMRATIRIFDSLLDISRTEADAGLGPGLVPIDLSAIAAEVWELYEPLAEERGLDAGAAIAPGLRILGDRNLVAQAISNLLDNAIKFTPPGERLRLALRPGEARHVLTVEDSGPGLPPEIRQSAFDRFVRAARDREVAGHGLGLALVRAIAARHGARLSLPDRPRGLAVAIAWPRLPEAAEGGAAPPAAGQGDPDSSRGGQRHPAPPAAGQGEGRGASPPAGQAGAPGGGR